MSRDRYFPATVAVRSDCEALYRPAEDYLAATRLTGDHVVVAMTGVYTSRCT